MLTTSLGALTEGTSSPFSETRLGDAPTPPLPVHARLVVLTPSAFLVQALFVFMLVLPRRTPTDFPNSHPSRHGSTKRR